MEMQFDILLGIEQILILKHKENQKLKFVEELGELITAFMKFEQYKKKYPNDEEIGTKMFLELKNRLEDEIADVEIMMYQMKRICNIDEEHLDCIKQLKIQRTLLREKGEMN
jgi:hypothetical protein